MTLRLQFFVVMLYFDSRTNVFKGKISNVPHARHLRVEELVEDGVLDNCPANGRLLVVFVRAFLDRGSLHVVLLVAVGPLAQLVDLRRVRIARLNFAGAPPKRFHRLQRKMHMRCEV